MSSSPCNSLVLSRESQEHKKWRRSEKNPDHRHAMRAAIWRGEKGRELHSRTGRGFSLGDASSNQAGSFLLLVTSTDRTG